MLASLVKARLFVHCELLDFQRGEIDCLSCTTSLRNFYGFTCVANAYARCCGAMTQYSEVSGSDNALRTIKGCLRMFSFAQFLIITEPIVLSAGQSHTLLYDVTLKSYNSANKPIASHRIGRCVFNKEKQVYQIHIKKGSHWASYQTSLKRTICKL